MLQTHIDTQEGDPVIAKHEVSEDGVFWRAYDPENDKQRVLHARIVFAEGDA